MSTSTDVTVWCNGCGTWEHIGNTAAEARKNAQACGWKVNLPGVEECPEGHSESLHRPGKPRDLCPRCVREGKS